jgi:hypothetical protein
LLWNAAVTVTEPAATAVKRPREPAAFDTVAVASLDDSQVTLLVMSAVVGGVSPHVPVAVSCWCPPTTTLSGVGVMVIELSVPLPTVRFEVPDSPWYVAVMVVVPALSGVATPVVAPTVATVLSEDVQVELPVTVTGVLSLRVTTATKGWGIPRWVVGLVGVTSSLVSVAVDTVRVVESVFPPKAPVIVVVPPACPVARPVVAPESEITATVPADDDQVVEAVTVAVE